MQSIQFPLFLNDEKNTPPEFVLGGVWNSPPSFKLPPKLPQKKLGGGIYFYCSQKSTFWGSFFVFFCVWWGWYIPSIKTTRGPTGRLGVCAPTKPSLHRVTKTLSRGRRIAAPRERVFVTRCKQGSRAQTPVITRHECEKFFSTQVGSIWDSELSKLSINSVFSIFSYVIFNWVIAHHHTRFLSEKCVLAVK